MKKDIITAMEKCISRYSCKGYEYYDYYPKCIYDLLKDALDFMKKQNEDMEILSRNSDTAFQDGLNEAQALYAEQVKAEIKSEAIKEFAERLNDRIINFPSVYPVENATLAFLNGSSHRQLEILEIIDNLAKEWRDKK